MKFGNFRYTLILVMLAMLVLPRPVLGGDKAEEKAAIKAYKNAYAALLDREYKTAHERFAKIIEEHKNTKVYDDARFWYCYAAEKSTRDLKKAFECYLEFVENFPDSKWREEALENAIRIAMKLTGRDPKYKAFLEKWGHSADHDLSPGIIEKFLESGEEEIVIKMFDGTSDTDKRRMIVYQLAECKSEKCIEKLADIARTDSDIDVRRNAVYALSECESEFCMSQLLEIAKTDADNDIRRHAIYALAEFDDKEIVVRLMVEILETETDTDIRRRAVYVIVEAEDPSTAPVLIDIALSDKDVDTARAATYGLAEMDDPRATEALIRLLTESKDSDTRRAALYALIERKDVSVLPTFLEIALDGKDRDLTMAAVWAIAEMENETEAALALIEIFKNSDNYDVRKTALYAIAENDNAKLGVELLKEAAQSTDDEELAKVAIYSLEDLLEDKDAGLLLEIHEKSPFTEVRKAAFYMLLEIGVDEAMSAIKKLLKTEVDPDIRAQAIWALEEADNEAEAVKILADVAKNDPSSKVRRAAMQVLGEIDSDEANKALLEIYRDRSKKKDKD